MKVAACQMPEVRRDSAAALALVRDYANAAATRGAALVCFPECFLQSYDVEESHVAETAIDLGAARFRRVLDELAGVEPVVVVGLIERDGGAFFNTAVAIERGRLVARYRKMRLLGGEQSVFARGAAPALFECGGMTVGLGICNDLNFAESIARSAAAGARVLACPCSNMLPRAAAEAWKLRHNEIRSRQARDHGLWIASSDIAAERDDRISYGPTAMINPGGTVVAQVPLLTTGMVVTEIT
jgi:predicted amidohydrolase